MLLPGLLLFVVAGVLFLDWGVTRMYRYQKVTHRKTPERYAIPFEEVWIPTEKGKRLYGWWMPAGEGAPVLVLVHGWGRNLARMMPYIRALHPMGYSLLAFDARNHGSSSPEKHPTVWTFSQDTNAAVTYLLEQGLAEPDRVGVIGLSVGGGAAINASARDHRIKSVVTVGAISHPVRVMQAAFEKQHVPTVVGNFLLGYMRLRFGLDFDAIAPVNNIRRSQASILLIHGDQDETIALAQAEALYQAGDKERVRLWVVPGKGHSDCHAHPQFWEKVGEFLAATLPGATPANESRR